MIPNHKQFIEAIKQKKRVCVRFYSKADSGVIDLICAPVDYGPGGGIRDGVNRYWLWDYTSNTGSSTLGLLPDQVLDIRVLGQVFDPADISSPPPTWSIPRDWGLMKTSGPGCWPTARTTTQPVKTNPLKDGAMTRNSAGLGTVTRKMVRERAVELAIINGRSGRDALKSDWEQAKRELTGEPDMDLKGTVLESAPESERWDPVSGSTGHKVQAAPSADEDDEGRSDNAKLVEEGIEGAEHDQMRQATRSASGVGRRER